MATNVSDTSDSSFEADVIKSSVPVIVDFWAPWCGPCKSIAPILDELASQYAGKLKILKLNVDDNRQASERFNVRSIPNLVFFKDGQRVEQIVGAQSKEAIETTIKKIL